MSLRSHPLRRRWLLVAACSLATILASCADTDATGPLPRPRLDGTSGDSTRTPCDTVRTTCHPTQPWG